MRWFFVYSCKKGSRKMTAITSWLLCAMNVGCSWAFRSMVFIALVWVLLFSIGTELVSKAVNSSLQFFFGSEKFCSSNLIKHKLSHDRSFEHCCSWIHQCICLSVTKCSLSSQLQVFYEIILILFLIWFCRNILLCQNWCCCQY